MDSKTDLSNLLPIGAFSAASRLSQKALRLYGRHKLLPPVYIDSLTGYRYYAAAQLADARLILLLREMDMPLACIRAVLVAAPDEVTTLVQTYCGQREEKAKREKRISGEVLRCLQERHNEKDTPMPQVQEKLAVTTFEAAPQLILGVCKRITVDALQDYFYDTRTRLTQFAQAQPDLEIVGDAFAIYHGPVGQEDDGPMEVCLPVRGRAIPIGDIVLRELAGGSMATATGTPEQCHFPRVLEIYDAVSGWICENGFTPDGPPREGWDERVQVTWLYKKAA